MRGIRPFLLEHEELTRRYFLRAGAGTAVAGLLVSRASGEPVSPELAQAIAKLESYLTKPDQFLDISRGTPLPHSLSEEKKHEVGLTRETWQLEMIADPDRPTSVRKPISKGAGNAITFDALMKLAEKRAVRFAKIMTCLNMGCPLGMGIWEGVPLRELIALVRPGDNVRRVYYYGYHNDDPAQIFRSSLPIDRVLEDPFDLPPVIVCYKLNGQWLTSKRGGPVRIVVPEAYGFKSVKWLSHIVLTSLPHANDTYAEQGNNIESPLKSFAATLSVPKTIKAGEPIPLTGYAQVGLSGLSKVQVWIQPEDEKPPTGDRYFSNAPWIDAEILAPPKSWGGEFPEEQLTSVIGFDSQTTQPKQWPMRLTKAHWAVLHRALPAGKYTLRCRAVDEKGIGQPLPRPMRNSGHAAIEEVSLVVE